MTEIKIEKKSPVWIWIVIGLIVLGVLLYFLFLRNTDKTENLLDKDTTNANDALPNGNENNSTVAAYINFVKNDTTAMSLDHAYSSEALHKLVGAVRAKADALNVDIKADLDSAKSWADQITVDPNKTMHADWIKKAAVTISGSLQRLQTEKFPTLTAEANAVSSSASSINAAELTLDQKATVQAFFNTAATLLQKMN